MEFCFKPLVWFVCRLCRQTFPDLDTLMAHKLENHLRDCLKIKSIIFEERFLEQPWTPAHTYSESTSKFNKDSGLSSLLSQQEQEPHRYPKISLNTTKKSNPFVSLTRLTKEEVEFALNIKDNCKTESGLSTLGKKRSSHCISESFHPEINDEEKNSNAPEAKQNHTELGNIINETFSEESKNETTDATTQEIIKIEDSSSENETESLIQVINGEFYENRGTNRNLSVVCGQDFEAIKSLQQKQQNASTSDSDYELSNISDIDACTENFSDSDLDADYEPERRFSSTRRPRNKKINYKQTFTSTTTTDFRKFSIKNLTSSSNFSSLSQILTKEPEPEPAPAPQISLDYKDSLPLHEWLTLLKQHSNSPSTLSKNKNIILLEPDPTTSTPNFDSEGTPLETDEYHPIKCLLCLRSLVTPSKVKNHVENCWFHNKSRHRFCTICQTPFESSLSLRKHNLTDHLENESSQKQNERVLDSDDGDDNESTKLPLGQWIRQHRKKYRWNVVLLQPDPSYVTYNNKHVSLLINEAYPITCKLCQIKLTTEAIVKSHIKFCWLSNKRKHCHCVPCKRSFSNPSNLRRHIKKYHNIKPNPKQVAECHQCKLCQQEFVDKKDLTRHEESLKEFQLHEDTIETGEIEGGSIQISGITLETLEQFPSIIRKQFACQVCPSSFLRNSDLKRHMSTHSEDRPQKCSHCPASYKSLKGLQVHLIGAHGQDSNHKCSFCGKAFYSKVLLKNHLRCHTGERPYKCQVSNCSSAFRSTGALKVHHGQKHGEELGLEKLLCPTCGDTFRVRGQLQRHIYFRHNDDFPFKCLKEGCSRRFKTKKAKEEHERVHTGEKPYQCEECGTAYGRATSFRKHQRTHDGTLPTYNCHLCPRKLTSRIGLMKHMTAHGRGTNFFCKFCGKVCKNKAYLKKHLKNHEKNIGNRSESKKIDEEDDGEDEVDDDNGDELSDGESCSSEDLNSDVESDIEYEAPVEAEVEMVVGVTEAEVY